ncbi:aminotransferase class V-fold PLP-dependent enzyme [Gallibacterium salpingitidis]|uniref:cysteine desulfurase n=1 Tax=Gallibacterium salpingitidis TaxID=505341 RepID=A0A1A7NQ35_9PAST|nr:cysteine desulfurase [Gallibacterium salpingitidis]OBW92312.1 cysteine desulfurase [Gallibacterium salpingitidis]
MPLMTMPIFDLENFRAEFPFLQQNPTAVYLDSAATTLRPQTLIEATTQFYCSAGSVHRSQYDWQQTQLFEQARQITAEFIDAEDSSCIVWTSGTTHSINTIAYGLRHTLSPNDEIIISEAEHHANFVVWQQLALAHKVKLVVLPLQANYQIDSAALKQALSPQTKIVALNLVSNVTGYRQPLEQFCPLIRQLAPNAFIVVDAAQAILHQKISLQQMDIDFLAFSAHKIFGPTGLGVLSGKKSALQQLTPLLFGGKMVQQVTNQQTTFQELPYRLEAGTPNIAAVIGFGAVLQWLQQYDFAQLMAYTQQLAQQFRQRLTQYANCQIFSDIDSHIISFVFQHIDNSDLATLLSEQQIALRTGQHCAQPYLHFLQQRGTLRISLAPYNHQQDLNLFFNALDNALAILEDE